MTKLRVFLADDHAVVRAGLKALINAEPDMEVIGDAANGAEAVARFAPDLPQVAVLDVSMPGMNGAQTASYLRKHHPTVKILALTVHEDRGYLRELLSAGASGYVLKRTGASELIRAIRAIAAGEVFLDSRVARNLVGNFVEPRSAQAPLGDLSDREVDTLRLVAQGHVTKEVADLLGVSAKTVETTKARAMEKLGLKNRVDLIREASRRGWLHDL